MRYSLKNLGPGSFYCVEVGKLLRLGDSVNVNRLDEGTKRLGDGPNKRLQIIDRGGVPASSSVPVPEAAPAAAPVPPRALPALGPAGPAPKPSPKDPKPPKAKADPEVPPTTTPVQSSPVGETDPPAGLPAPNGHAAG